ncbi:oligosaccharide flippase family protein [Pseudoalteromonas sp. APC 3691]|uniref:lipopolysaccharide biosynthesis protein n=1 Tax=Pseudoalteromonas sp. APC 3691 TaxID=3035173 RepID=UPI0025B5C6F8|nr:oligosaccharide flippase family protein [Pseudoalteromonas sp. APC 3691]MDN3389541.1 oligosaccharide flippase family protein [Pseudoalteromonas sp. APC 3691]
MKGKIIQYAIGPIGTAIIGLVTLPLITWFYSVEDVGRISMLQVVASFSILLCCLGLDQAYIREYHEVDNKPLLLKLSFLPGFVLICLVYGGSIIFSPTIISQWLYNIPSSSLSLLSIACFITAYTSRFLSLVVRMEERALAYSMSQLIPKVFFLIFIICTVWVGFKQDIYSLIAAHMLSVFIVCLVFLWNTKHEWNTILSCGFNWHKLKLLLIFGLPLVVGGLASWGLNVMDKVFLRSLSTFEELGVYSVTISIAGVATVFSGIFNTIWAPMIYKWEKNGIDIKSVDKISEHVLAAVFFAVVLVGLFSWMLPYFLPKEYLAIKYLVALCLLSPLFYTLSETTAVGISISRRTGLSMLASIVAMLINGIGNYILVPEYGALGAAISTSIAFYFFYILRTEFSRKVWRNIPTTKTYLIITLLLFTAISNAVLFQGTNTAIIIWGGLLFFGFFIFNNSIQLLYKLVRNSKLLNLR